MIGIHRENTLEREKSEREEERKRERERAGKQSIEMEQLDNTFYLAG